MVERIVSINCPNCGASVDTAQRNCVYCRQPVVISSFSSVYEMPVPLLSKYANTYRQVLSGDPDNKDLNNSIAMCYLKLRLHEKALAAFERATEDNFDNSETFFFAAVCLLKGNKAFNTPIDDIKKALNYINAAIQIEPRGIYFFFAAYLKYDHHERKFLNIAPNYAEELQNAKRHNLTAADIQMLFDVIGKPIPEQLQV